MRWGGREFGWDGTHQSRKTSFASYLLPQSEPLQSVVDHMAAHLGVSPSRILLLFGETELSPTATPRTLKLGVADIIGERKAGRWILEETFATGRG